MRRKMARYSLGRKVNVEDRIRVENMAKRFVKRWNIPYSQDYVVCCWDFIQNEELCGRSNSPVVNAWYRCLARALFVKPTKKLRIVNNHIAYYEGN